MKIDFNLKKLQQVMIDFYNCTNIPITLFDRDCKCLFGYGRQYAYCSNLRNLSPDIANECIISDEKHFARAKETATTILYTCHAGICETVTPIFYQNVIIAYLMLGKFRDEEQVYSSSKTVRKAAKKYDLDAKEKLKEYRELPVMSASQLQSAINILKICIRHIWSENLIKLNKNMLPSQIEDYISENLKSSLTVEELCAEFFISKETLYEIFHDEYNDTIKNFIITKRIEMGKKLLLETTLPVSVVADQIGFTDYNYFIRVFKKRTSLTPLQFRKRNPIVKPV